VLVSVDLSVSLNFHLLMRTLHAVNPRFGLVEHLRIAKRLFCQKFHWHGSRESSRKPRGHQLFGIASKHSLELRPLRSGHQIIRPIAERMSIVQSSARIGGQGQLPVVLVLRQEIVRKLNIL
jgi:hypothetical protein